MGNGTFRGFPKGRNAVPYNQLRNLKGVFEENNQFLIRYTKGALLGGLIGVNVGAIALVLRPFKFFELQ